MAFGNKQYSYNDVPDGTRVYLTGTITYNRIHSKIDGDEKAERDQRDIAAGRQAPQRPYNLVDLEDVQICLVPEAATNPAMQLANAATEERFYTSIKNNKLCWRGKNTSQNPVEMGYIDTSTGKPQAQRINSDKDFAPGQKALVIARVFNPNKGGVGPKQNGISVESVYVYTQNGQPPQFYSNAEDANTAAVANALAGLGITMAEGTKDFFDPAPPEPVAPVIQSPMYQPQTQVQQPQVPMSAPVAPVVSPVPPAQPQPPVQPMQPTYQQPVQQPAIPVVQTPAPAPAVQPGISYTPYQQ